MTIAEDEADYLYEVGCWEVTYPATDIEEIMVDRDQFDVVEIGRLKRLPSRFAVRLYDEDGDLVTRWFDSRFVAECAATDARTRLNELREEEDYHNRRAQEQAELIAELETEEKIKETDR
jgi:hypothetical protein